MSKKSTSKPATQEREIPLAWNIPSDLRSGYATNMMVQVGEHEIFVSFFETTPPVIFKPADMEKVGSVTAECIARIVIAPDRMQAFIDVLQTQLGLYRKKKAEETAKK